MDPVSHAAFGRTLVALDARRRLGAGAIAACVFGSLTPDIDAVYMPIGWDIYLRRHQGGTHSLIGSLACAALTAALVRLSVRESRYPRLLLAAWGGTAGHLLLDWISGADIGFLWPAGSPIALPLFAMADPWLAGPLVLGLIALAFTRATQGRTAAAILLALSVLAAAKGALYVRAQALRDASDRTVQSRRSDVQWGSLTSWIAYETRADFVESHLLDGWRKTVVPLLRMPRGMHDPLVVKSQELDTVRNFQAAHAVTFAIVTAGGEHRRVLWSDLRYCGPTEVRSEPWAPIDLGTASPISCGVWSGGEFDMVSPVPRAALVYVGHIVQTRAVR